MEPSLRRATPADAERLAANVADGFAGYRSFAPPDWRAPTYENELRQLQVGLERPDVWCLLAEADGELAGHVALRSAASAYLRPSDEPGLAHFWQLFVRPAWHGSGLAATLHDEAVREAGERGYRALRLFVVERQARARRFYEREGWAAAGPAFDSAFGLALVEYRRPINSNV